MLHSEVIVPAREPGRARLVLVHGFTQTGRSWSRELARDLACGGEVIAVDAPGHGGSAHVRADLPEGARQVAETAGRGAYLGYSMGGRLCLHLALSHPDLVTRLVLVGATAGIDDAEERAARRRSDDALASELEAIGVARFVERWLSNAMFAGLTPEAANVAARLENTVEGLASSLRLAGTGAQEPLWDRLPELSMPVLVVVGERDEKFRQLGERLVAGIGGAATLAVVPAAGHTAHAENHGGFVAAVRPFLADHGSTSARTSAAP